MNSARGRIPLTDLRVEPLYRLLLAVDRGLAENVKEGYDDPNTIRYLIEQQSHWRCDHRRGWCLYTPPSVV